MKRLYIVAGLVVVFGTGALILSKRAMPAMVPTSDIATSAGSISQANVGWSAYGQQYIEVMGQGLSTSYGQEKPLPAASIAKIMTALAILHAKPLALGQQGPTLTMTPADVSVYQQEFNQNESVVKVSVGEQLSEYQALQAMLIASATNVADTTATWAFGSISSYDAFANQYAAQLGLTHTHFGDDASGFSPANVSTAADLVKLGEAALANPVVAQIVAQKSATLPVAGTVQNFNIDLGESGVNGIKTGNTDQAGGAFLYSASYQGQTIIGATMGAPDLGTALHDAPEVLSSFENNIQIDHPIQAGQVVAHYTLPWGGTVQAVAQKDVSVVSWQGDKPAVQTSFDTLRKVSPAGTQVGTITVTYDGKSQQASVVLRQAVTRPSILWRIFHL